MHQFPGAWSCLAPYYLVCHFAAGRWVGVFSFGQTTWESLQGEWKTKQSWHVWCRPEPFGILAQLRGHILLSHLSHVTVAFQALAFIPSLDLRFSDLIVLLCPIEGCVLSSSCIWYKADRYWWKSVGLFLFSLALFSDLSSPNLPNSQPRKVSMLFTG